MSLRPSRRHVLAGLATAVPAAILQGTAAAQDDGPEQVYARLAHATLVLPERGGELAIAAGDPKLLSPALLDWVRTGARAVTAYYDRFPIRRYGLMLVGIDGDGIGHGTTWGYRGTVTRLEVGRQAAAPAFADDWKLVHEMAHGAFPNLPRRALWLQEGNATWIEPVARAQIGAILEAEVWRQAVPGMARGGPQLGEGGMDGTRRWGRLYWGGAAFWLQAEVAIFERTAGRRSLQDAMRAVNRRSGGNIAEWSPEQVMRAGDAAIGAALLAPLYSDFATAATWPDLPRLFERLGVAPAPTGGVRLVDAPLAPLRRAITAPRSG